MGRDTESSMRPCEFGPSSAPPSQCHCRERLTRAAGDVHGREATGSGEPGPVNSKEVAFDSAQLYATCPLRASESEDPHML